MAQESPQQLVLTLVAEGASSVWIPFTHGWGEERVSGRWL